ncbi:MAG: hypothetical protein ACD_37C00088G0001 [uncultured bacterium]|nr:MAG: hypothetical protein ACD_37C00088G0001 [uncultured bacterium]
MAAERRSGLRRFIPFVLESITSDERAAQAVRDRRRIAEQGLRFRYNVAQELVVPNALVDEGGRVKVLTYTHRLEDGSWGSTAIPFNPGRKSTDPAVILGRITIDALSLEDAASVTDGWVDNSAGPLNNGDTTRMQMVPQLEGKYGQSIHKVVPNTP